jgi:hypothetical protein
MSTLTTFDTRYGFKVNVGPEATGQTPVHKMANIMWLPMLAMGLMVLAGTLVAGIVQANLSSDAFPGGSATDRATVETMKALLPGVIFVGVAFLLAGISFLLASVLGAMRGSGGALQQQLAREVYTPRMPASAWAFMALMMAGLMVALTSLGFHIYAAVQVYDYYSTGVPPAADALHLLGRAETVLSYAAPLSMVGIGLLLSGIVLALYTIGNVLRFQFDRVQELILGRTDIVLTERN